MVNISETNVVFFWVVDFAGMVRLAGRNLLVEKTIVWITAVQVGRQSLERVLKEPVLIVCVKFYLFELARWI